MVNDMISKTIAAIINGYDNNIYNKEEKEDLSNISIPILQKKLKHLNEQSIYFQAENRLLYNYLTWYEKKILPLQTLSQEKQHSILQSKFPHQIKQLLSIEKKCELAESSFKVLLAYLEKFNLNSTESIDQYTDTIETDDETIKHFEVELIVLKKFLHHIQKQITAKEFFDFFRDRIRYYETLNERKRQKTVRLRFNLDILEKSLEKLDQTDHPITLVDFEHLKIDIEKQLKELNTKNKMLTYYKQHQLEINTEFNLNKSQLSKEIRLSTSIRNEINNKVQKLHYYNQIQQKMQDEIEEYEKSNKSLQQMNSVYRVPSIDNYVNLKSQQINLHHHIQAWQRKLQIAERELHIRQYESIHYPESIIHPWKYLRNPSSIIFYKHYQI